MRKLKRALALLLALMLLLTTAVSEEQLAPEAMEELIAEESAQQEPVEEEPPMEEPAGEEPAIEESAEEVEEKEPAGDAALPAAPEVLIAPEWEYDAETGAITIPYGELPETLTFEWSFDGEAAQYAVQTAPVPEGDNPEERCERIFTDEPRIELPAANYAGGGWFSLYVVAILEDGTEIEGWKYFRLEQREGLDANELPKTAEELAEYLGMTIEELAEMLDMSAEYIIELSEEEIATIYEQWDNSISLDFIDYNGLEAGSVNEPSATSRITLFNQHGEDQYGNPDPNCHDIWCRAEELWLENGALGTAGCGLFTFVHAIQWLTGNKLSTTGKDLGSGYYLMKILRDKEDHPSAAGGLNEYYKYVINEISGIKTVNAPTSESAILDLFSNEKHGVVIINAPGHYALAVGAVKANIDGNGTKLWIHCVDSSYMSTVRRINDAGGAAYAFNDYRKITSSRAWETYVAGEYWVSYNDLYRIARWTGQQAIYREIPVETIKLSNSKLNLITKQTEALTATIYPVDAANKTLQWISSDERVATVSQSGEVKALAAGEATITCKAQDGSGVSASCQVTVVDYRIDPAEIMLGVGQTATLVAKQGDKKISSTFSTSDNSIVSITKDKKDKAKIKITAKGIGSATITATTKDGKTATCQVTVKPAPETITIDSNLGKNSMNIGDTISLRAICTPTDALTKVTWGMSEKDKKKKIVSLDTSLDPDFCLVKGLKAGSVTITAKTHNNKSEKFNITIIDPTMPTDIAMSIDGRTPLEDGEYRALYIDETFTPKPILYPDTAESKLEWKSSNTKIATVKNGVITPKKKGRALITVWPKKTGKKASANIYVDVEDPQPPKKITGLSVKTLGVGDTWQFVYSLSPENARTKVSFKSSKASVASVDESGLIKAKKTGKATITATTHNGKKTKCKITVKKAPNSLQLDRESVELSVNGTYQLTCFIPTGTAGTITFTSSDKAIASVNDKALITAHKEGSCVITAKTKNGLRADCVVTVRPSSEPTGVSLGISEPIKMKVGERKQLVATVSPANAKTTLTWKDVKNVAQDGVAKSAIMIDQNGVVTAIHQGTGAVRVYTSNNHYDTVEIEISKADDGSVELYSNDVMQIFYQINARRTGTTPVVIDDELCKRAEKRLYEIKDEGSALVTNEVYGSGLVPIAGRMSLHATQNKKIAEMLAKPSHRKVGIAVVLLGSYKLNGCYMLIFE